jgi:hypothetical protein
LYFADREKGEGKMNKKAVSMMIMLLASTLMIVIVPTTANGGPSIAIVPSSQTFTNPPVGTTFTVSCLISNIVNLYGVDIQIGWNTTYITYVGHTKTIPVETYPTGILHKNTMPVKDDVNESDNGFGGSYIGTMYWLSEASMAPAAAFNGNGTAFIMTFQIVYNATAHKSEPDVHTSIHFFGVVLSDAGGLPIPNVTQIDGNITIKNPSVIYPPEPLLKVLPTDYYGVNNTMFDVSIVLMGEDHGSLSPWWDVAGFDLVLTYNASLIEGFNATCDPDGWFATFWPGGSFTVENGTYDALGLAWIAFLGIPGYLGNHTLVYGQGRIAAVHFKSIYEQVPPPFVGPTCALDIENSTIAGFPHEERLYDPWNGLPTAVPLPHKVENGTYHAPVSFVTGIDIYTQWDIHYGKGINNPTDMLWPQKAFIVYALVQYNKWPEQQKDVAFELIDPWGAVRGIYYNRTDDTGHCWVFIRMPWPCDDPEYQFGYVNGLPTPWKIVATVDIACKVYNDTMPFKYDYRVRIFKTTLDKDIYNHGDDIIVTIDYGSVSYTEFWALFTVTGVDVTGVPFSFDYTWAFLGDATWCTMKNDTLTLTLHIPKYARAGFPATVYVGVLSNWPAYGGDAYYPTRKPETIVEFSINPS